MTCGEALPVIRDHADRELDAATASALDAHLEACASCRRRLSAERELKLAVRAKVRPHHAPAGLAAAIAREVREEARSGLPAPAPRRRRLLAAAALAIAAAALGAALVLTDGRPHPGRTGAGVARASPIATTLIDDHIRYLGQRGAEQLATRDPREAERWFASRLDIAVTLPFADREVLALTGGRLCYVLDRRVALLFYTHGTRRLSLFVMSASGLGFEGMDLVDLAHARCATETYKGFEVVCWMDRGLLYALVSERREAPLAGLVARAIPR